MTYEQLNSMIVNNMNNLKSYSRTDLEWYPIASIANMDFHTANSIEKNIHALATQEPLPSEQFTLTVINGTGSGEYEANAVANIQANTPEEGLIFDHWSGDHLENIGNATAAITTYRMPYQDVTLRANYTSAIPHTLTIITNTGTTTVSLSMGEIQRLVADPAPQGKVFHHWQITPTMYEDNLYEPAATTTFTMPNENVTITAIYITKGRKYLSVTNGKISSTGESSGYFEYDATIAIIANTPSSATFNGWTGDIQYLTEPTTQEYNYVKIPDGNVHLTATWISPPTPLGSVRVTIVNGVIASTGETTGTFMQGSSVNIQADAIPEGKAFYGWTTSTYKVEVASKRSMNTSVYLPPGVESVTITANRRNITYSTLTVTTASGTTTATKEAFDYFSVNATPIPNNHVFTGWTGDTSSYYPWGLIDTTGGYFDTSKTSAGTYMGYSDRTITANYRELLSHTLTVAQPSGDVTYTQLEQSTIAITAEAAPTGQVFYKWTLSGSGSISSYDSASTTYRFGNGDATLTPSYRNVRTITIVNGVIRRSDNSNYDNPAILKEGVQYRILSRGLAKNEKFDGWTINGPGTITNIASTDTYFTVGDGDATITANISQYPDKTVTIYMRDPDTDIDTLVSSTTYTYGSKVVIQAPVAPSQSTFSTWLGDTDILYPSALASSVTIRSLNKDTTITATYFYPESPEYYTLTVYDGYPESGSYPVGEQVSIRAKEPSQGWEFYNWYGDTEYLVDQDLTQNENSVIIPLKSITLYAKFKAIGELPLYRVSVTNGIASGTYVDSEEVEHNESGVYIDIPAGTEVTLTADPDVVGWTFNYWNGNFEAAGVDDITVTDNPATFTMTEHDLNITMVRRELDKYTVYPTNATGPGTVYPGVYPIAGNLVNTDSAHYEFNRWYCRDISDNDYSQAIANLYNVETNITLTDRDLWVTADYNAFYKLTVVGGQDTGTGFYAPTSTITSITANTPTTGMQFDHWEDPGHVISTTLSSIYDPTPIITMPDYAATITAVFTSLDATGNSIAITGDTSHSSIIRRSNTSLINGIFTIGTIIFDGDGCISVITGINPDQDDNTDDYTITNIYYGGNF
jgi:hypothetical protein